MDELDLKMYLLHNRPITIPNVGELYSLTIGNILDILPSTYNRYLFFLSLDKDDIKNMLNIEENIEVYDFIILNCIHDKAFCQIICEALSCFFKEKVTFIEQGYFYLGTISECRYIYKDNFDEIINIIQKQNCIKQKNKIKPKNDKQKEYLEKVAKMRKKYEKAINADEGDISDIISSVSAKHPSINLFNIENLSVYQLVNQFCRLNYIDDYFISIASLQHGASNEDIKIKHWSKKLEY